MDESNLLDTMRAAFPMVEWDTRQFLCGDCEVFARHGRLEMRVSNRCATAVDITVMWGGYTVTYTTDDQAPSALRRALAKVVALGDAAREVVGG